MAVEEHSPKVETLCRLALKLGAKDARHVDPSSVITGEWVRLKCQYGCDGYGQCLTCPPYSPTPSTTRRVLDGYKTTILVHLPSDWRRLREIISSLEREAFLMGFHKAFAMGSGPCHLCGSCPRSYPCVHPDEARPSMEACGIDVYTTARNAGFTIEVATSRNSPTSYFGLLLVE
ncbi:MAG TPA: DUF2284 domain-containing protein [Firmicutes bacterium]|nr:DUF2284 domain-containing protein [Bacillota bacterium]HHY98491.1 DUF2284 domain-containing protein [Bacillota bacterium]